MTDPIRLCPHCHHPLQTVLPRRAGRCAVLVEMVHPGDFDQCGCGDLAHTRPQGHPSVLRSLRSSARRARAIALARTRRLGTDPTQERTAD